MQADKPSAAANNTQEIQLEQMKAKLHKQQNQSATAGNNFASMIATK